MWYSCVSGEDFCRHGVPCILGSDDLPELLSAPVVVRRVEHRPILRGERPLEPRSDLRRIHLDGAREIVDVCVRQRALTAESAPRVGATDALIPDRSIGLEDDEVVEGDDVGDLVDVSPVHQHPAREARPQLTETLHDIRGLVLLRRAVQRGIGRDLEVVARGLLPVLEEVLRQADLGVEGEPVARVHLVDEVVEIHVAPALFLEHRAQLLLPGLHGAREPYHEGTVTDFRQTK